MEPTKTTMMITDFYQNSTVELRTFEAKDALPFPLYMSEDFRAGLTIVMLMALVIGIRFRVFIFNYLRSPDSKGPVNFLIWIDQLNGIFLCMVILIKVVLINFPIPLSQVFGEVFCEWIDLPGCIYIVGATVWTTFIAFYRIIFIKAQNWLKFKIGERNLLRNRDIENLSTGAESFNC